jgi:hypothetical protein
MFRLPVERQAAPLFPLRSRKRRISDASEGQRRRPVTGLCAGDGVGPLRGVRPPQSHPFCGPGPDADPEGVSGELLFRP